VDHIGKAWTTTKDAQLTLKSILEKIVAEQQGQKIS
jgi:hypothetical protein